MIFLLGTYKLPIMLGAIVRMRFREDTYYACWR